MAEIVNLRRARKAKARAEKAELAAENRVRHGRSGTEKRRDRSQRETDSRALDGKRIDQPDEG